MKTEKDFKDYIENILRMAQNEGWECLDETYVEHLRCRFFSEEVVIGKSERIMLRELQMSDLEAFYTFEKAEGDAVLGEFLQPSYEETREYLASYRRYMYPMYDYGMWAVVKMQTGEVIGICGLDHPKENMTDCVELGYYICPECRRQGFAAESIEIVLDYAKNYLEIPFICAIIKEENRISKKVLEKFGFTFFKEIKGTGQKLSVYQKVLKE